MHLEVLGDKQKKIFSQLKGFKEFYLAGGTALALQIGHRVSVDFDLFSEKDIEKNLLPVVKKTFEPDTVIASVNNVDELTIFVNEAKVTFLKYPFPVLSDLIQYKGVSLLDPREIAVTKAYTIGRRGAYKDYVDLYFTISEGHISLSDIISLAEKKYGNEFHNRLFLEQLVYFEDLSDTEVMFLKEPVTKEDIRLFFTEAIKKVNL